jgi:hypothetical protein
LQISADSELNNGNNGNVTRIPYHKQFETYKEYLICTWDDQSSDTPALVQLWATRVFPNISAGDTEESPSGTATGNNTAGNNTTAAISNDANDMIEQARRNRFAREASGSLFSTPPSPTRTSLSLQAQTAASSQTRSWDLIESEEIDEEEGRNVFGTSIETLLQHFGIH